MMMFKRRFRFLFLMWTVLVFGALFLFVGPALSQDKASIEKGKDIFGLYGCFACHGWDGTGGKISQKYVVASAGPSIENIARSYRERYGDKWRNELVNWIKEPTPEKVNNDKKRKEYFDLYGYHMPVLGLTDGEVEAVIGFIDTFRK